MNQREKVLDVMCCAQCDLFRAQWKGKVTVAKKSEQKSISLFTTEEAKIEGWDDEDETDWRRIIQPLLQYIRFPIMNGEYFTSKVVDMKILSTDDCTLIMQFLFTQKENDALKYSTKKRYIPTKGLSHGGVETKSRKTTNRFRINLY